MEVEDCRGMGEQHLFSPNVHTRLSAMTERAGEYIAENKAGRESKSSRWKEMRAEHEHLRLGMSLMSFLVSLGPGFLSPWHQ